MSKDIYPRYFRMSAAQHDLVVFAARPHDAAQFCGRRFDVKTNERYEGANWSLDDMFNAGFAVEVSREYVAAFHPGALLPEFSTPSAPQPKPLKQTRNVYMDAAGNTFLGEPLPEHTMTNAPKVGEVVIEWPERSDGWRHVNDQLPAKYTTVVLAHITDVDELESDGSNARLGYLDSDNTWAIFEGDKETMKSKEEFVPVMWRSL